MEEGIPLITFLSFKRDVGGDGEIKRTVCLILHSDLGKKYWGGGRKGGEI
ncbi:hypothetical protein Tco_1535846, partial [Tanacetum coccineum]